MLQAGDFLQDLVPSFINPAEEFLDVAIAQARFLKFGAELREDAESNHSSRGDELMRMASHFFTIQFNRLSRMLAKSAQLIM